MWARMVECMLGIWMMISPFIFDHPTSRTELWFNDLGVGLVLVVLSLASYWSPTGWAHLLLLPAGIWLVVFGRFLQSMPLGPAAQNQVVVGSLLLLFAIVPNHASRPPQSWDSADAAEIGRSDS